METLTISAHAASAPAYLMRFIGREEELAVLAGLLSDETVRWITITGPSGVGKTRLAVEAVRAYQTGSPGDDGSGESAAPAAWFVPLLGIADAALVPAIVAREIEPATSETDSVEVIRRAVERRRIILLLDNVDAVLAAGATLAALLTLPGCERVTLLTTSRTPFDLPGEHHLAIAPLPVPDEVERDADRLRENAAVRLFLSCARAARADLTVADRDLPVVSDICRRLDGLPLAIELAGRRARRLSLDAIAAQLRESRFSLDGGPAAPGMPGHLSLRESIARSYEPLPKTLKQFFLRLSVFGGGISLESARRVAAGIDTGRGYPYADGYGRTYGYTRYIPDPGLADAPALRGGAYDLAPLALDPIESLEQLADLSLIQRVFDPGGATRYQFLETIAEFARAELTRRGELEAVHHAHAAIMLALVEAAAQGLWITPDGAVGVEQLDIELTNARLALERLIDLGVDAADLSLRVADEMTVYFQRRGMLPEGLGWLARALALDAGGRYRRANALSWFAFYSWMVGEIEQADLALRHSFAVLEGSGLAALLGRAHFFAALVLWRRGPEHLPAMVGHLQQALAHFAEWNDGIGTGVCKLALGEIARLGGQSASAIQLFGEAYDVFGVHGYEWGKATARWFTGEAYRSTGDESTAAKFLAEGLRLYRQTGDRLGMSGCLAGIACLLAARREWRLAARYFGTAAALRERTQSLLPPTHEAEHELVAEAVLTAIGTEDFEEGKRFDPPEVVSEALVVAGAIASGKPVHDPRAPHPELTRMQREVLIHLVGGSEPKEIAGQLNRGVSTIYRHLEKLRLAFNVETDDELRRRAEPLLRAGPLEA